ncbi:MAG: YceI family protein [Candidatus Binatia bacterium]
MHRSLYSIIAVATLTVPGLAGASTWKIDPAHTSAQFAVRHMMVSTVRGTIGPVAGTLNLDEADATKSSIVATVDVNAIDTREPQRDAHLKSADFFDAGTYPTITFNSKRITKVGEAKYQVAGDLTIHGVTKEVVLDVEGAPTPFKDPTGSLRMGGSATTKLNRKDFGLTWNKTLDSGGLVIGDEVAVTIDIELIKAQ